VAGGRAGGCELFRRARTSAPLLLQRSEQ